MTEASTVFVSGSLITLLGYLIKYKHWTFLVAGYDQATSSLSPETVAEIAGSMILRIGIATIVLASLEFFYVIPVYVYILFAIGILLASGRLVYRLNTYEESTD